MNALNCSAVYLLECNQPLTGSCCLTIRILAQEKLNKLEFTFYKAAFGKKVSSMFRARRNWKGKGLEVRLRAQQNAYSSWAPPPPS